MEDNWTKSYVRRLLLGFHADELKRSEMFQSAQLEHVHKLHHYGRQLSILKRLYESYNLIIERITTGPPPILRPKALKHAHLSSEGHTHHASDAPDSPVEARRTLVTYGVPISHAAAARFERLKDRITLLALSEIKACLDEKESLMALVCLEVNASRQLLIGRVEL